MKLLTKKHNPVISFAPALCLAGLIFFFSHQSVLPSLNFSTLDFLFKKTAHVVVYVSLYLLLYRGFRLAYPDMSQIKRVLFCVVITFLYAASDELHQTFVPGRTGTIRDIGFDMLGIGVILLRMYRYI